MIAVAFSLYEYVIHMFPVPSRIDYNVTVRQIIEAEKKGKT